MSQVILPGAVLGVLGSGQLGRMFAVAAREMGYRVHTLSPDSDTPTGQISDVEVRAAYEDLDAVATFAQQVDVVTFEFENVPVAAAECAARFAPVRPGGNVLHTTQNRLREKVFLRQIGAPTTVFAPVRTPDELSTAVATVGLPAILKTADWGYDGKGQHRAASAADVSAAWDDMQRRAAVLERLVDFAQEISVIAARDLHGQIVCYPPFANVHARQILDYTGSPAAVAPRVAEAALEIARTIMRQLDVVGVLCVEFFVTHDDSVLVNELAPRPHNSGHLTIDAHVTSQFEQQVRTVCGLPIGSTEQLRPAAMANLLGDLWARGEPNWRRALELPSVKLHLYGKNGARAGRKMGHLTALGASVDAATATVLEARRRLME